jgi:hypothetical protein
LLVRRKNRWEDSIKMVTNEIRYEGVDWIRVAQDGAKWTSLMNTLKIFGSIISKISWLTKRILIFM